MLHEGFSLGFVQQLSGASHGHFHSPCRLQYSRAQTSLALVLNIATGSSPGCKCLRITEPPLHLSSIHSIWCSGSIGCKALPTVTLYPPSIFSTTGTCFSFAPSVVFSLISVMGLPQHTNSPLPQCSTSTMLPQTAHL